MESIIWIQNSDEDKADFVYENFVLMNEESINKQQNHISEILNSKKKSKEILLEPHLKIYNRGNNYIIDLKSDDLDKYGRKGSAMIFLRNYQQENQPELKNNLAKIFANTGTVITDNFLSIIFSELIKKKNNNLISYYSIAVIFVLLLIILFVLKYNK